MKRNKILTYSIFGVASLLVIVTFLTAQSYVQLGVAVLLYPVLAYFALKIFQRKSWKAPIVTIRLPAMSKIKAATARPKGNPVHVADIDKRTFLKLIGAAGLSFFVFSLLGRGVETLLFGKPVESGLSGSLGNPATGGGVDPAGTSSPMSGYRITEVDDGAVSYYGFTNQDGAWMIMKQDTDTSSFRYAKGDLNFPANWTRRGSLKYDYYYNLF